MPIVVGDFKRLSGIEHVERKCSSCNKKCYISNGLWNQTRYPIVKCVECIRKDS